MTTATYLLPQFDNEIQSTRRVLECVPEDRYGWKPHAKSSSLGQLAGHVADLPNFLSTMITTDELELSTSDFKPFLPDSRTALLAHLEKSAAGARALIAGASEDHLARTWTLRFKGQEVFGGPRTLLLPTTLGHLIHHRGQLTVYLRLNEIKIPGVYGPSADEMAAFA